MCITKYIKCMLLSIQLKVSKGAYIYAYTQIYTSTLMST